MVERFFSTVSTDLHRSTLMLLSGPPSSGKTSLLFQFAINYVVDTDDKSVVFICRRRKLDAKPPFLSQGIDPSSHVFDRIQMKYLEDEEGINKFFAAFHMHHTIPGLVVVDDLGEFFDERNCQQRYRSPRGRELAIVRTLALCRSAFSHAKRWINSIYTIKGDGIGSFILKNNNCLEMVRTKAAKYSIALQYLVLEEMYENEQQRKAASYIVHGHPRFLSSKDAPGSVMILSSILPLATRLF